jgi:type I restriction enzyme S subunit
MINSASGQISVSDAELDIINQILRKTLAGQDVYVFGSRARGDHKKTSDLDLAISGAAPLTMAVRSDLEFKFSESDLPFRVDIVDLLTTDESFKKIIQADAIKLQYA